MQIVPEQGAEMLRLEAGSVAVTTDQVRAVFAANGLEASVLQTGDGFLEIKTEPIGLSEVAPSPTPPAWSTLRTWT